MGGGGGSELLACPYPLKVKAFSPGDQRPAIWSMVCGAGLNLGLAAQTRWTNKYQQEISFIYYKQ